jgi:hypothetical protein
VALGLWRGHKCFGAGRPMAFGRWIGAHGVFSSTQNDPWRAFNIQPAGMRAFNSFKLVKVLT